LLAIEAIESLGFEDIFSAIIGRALALAWSLAGFSVESIGLKDFAESIGLEGTNAETRRLEQHTSMDTNQIEFFML
jgi:hypothetical protein